MLYQIAETELYGHMYEVLIWLEVELYLMFAIAVGARGFSFPKVSLSLLTSCFCLQRESASCSSFQMLPFVIILEPY